MTSPLLPIDGRRRLVEGPEAICWIGGLICPDEAGTVLECWARARRGDHDTRLLEAVAFTSYAAFHTLRHAVRQELLHMHFEDRETGRVLSMSPEVARRVFHLQAECALGDGKVAMAQFLRTSGPFSRKLYLAVRAEEGSANPFEAELRAVWDHVHFNSTQLYAFAEQWDPGPLLEAILGTGPSLDAFPGLKRAAQEAAAASGFVDGGDGFDYAGYIQRARTETAREAWRQAERGHSLEPKPFLRHLELLGWEPVPDRKRPTICNPKYPDEPQEIRSIDATLRGIRQKLEGWRNRRESRSH